jgi:hypothetical protein
LSVGEKMSERQGKVIIVNWNNSTFRNSFTLKDRYISNVLDDFC